MRINSGSPAASPAVQRSADASPAESAAAASTSSSPATALQSDVLQPAMAALRAMPEVDHDRVAQLRDALAKGELPFDPGKLAGLIQRFHGGES